MQSILTFLKLTCFEFNILVGIPERMRPLGRHWRRWEDNIKMVLEEIGWMGVDWIDLTKNNYQWLAVVNTAMKARVL
jgi:hypothetical protein